jgi:hypothetical protein
MLVQYRGIQSHKCLQQMSKLDGVTVRSVQWHHLSPNFPFHESDTLSILEAVDPTRNPLRESVIVVDLLIFGLDPERHRVSAQISQPCTSRNSCTTVGSRGHLGSFLRWR